MQHVTSKRSSPFLLFAFLLSATIVALDIVRIIRIPATHDEVAFLPLVRSHSYTDIMQLRHVVSPNTHLLNSLATKFFIETFADNLFFLRLGSLLALVVYLTFSSLICARVFKYPLWQVSTFLLLNCNPFLFDMWTLSRGYGMAIALMMSGIYCLVLFLDNKKIRSLAISLALSAASVYANFSLLNFFMAVVIIAIADAAIERKGRGRLAIKVSVVIIAVSALLYLLIKGPVQKLIDGKQLFGGVDGFYTDTLRSVVKESLFNNDVNSGTVTGVCILVMMATFLSGIYWAVLSFRHKADANAQRGIMLWLLMILPVLSTIAQHYLLGVYFLIDRTALFMYVPFVLAISYCGYHISQKQQRVANIAICLLTIAVSLHFVRKFSLSSTWRWAYDSNDITVLERMKGAARGRKVRSRVHWLFMPSLTYHSAAYSSYLEPPVKAEYLNDPNDTFYDYYYVPKEEMLNVPKAYVPDTFFTVRNTYLHHGEFVLMKRK